MKYLKGEDILIIHARIIDATGGLHGVRDVNLLASLVERPKSEFGGKEQFRGVFQKAAVYLESITQYHTFVDGNKRTAVASAARFLGLNGYELTATNKEVEKFVLRVVTDKLDIKTIASWFKKHSRKK